MKKSPPTEGIKKSQDGGSNPGPIAYEAIALPAELSWHYKLFTSNIYILQKNRQLCTRSLIF